VKVIYLKVFKEECQLMTGPIGGHQSRLEMRVGVSLHPADDDQEWDDECADLLQDTSQRPNHNTAEYGYDRAADADPNSEFHLALGDVVS